MFVIRSKLARSKIADGSGPEWLWISSIADETQITSYKEIEAYKLQSSLDATYFIHKNLAIPSNWIVKELNNV